MEAFYPPEAVAAGYPRFELEMAIRDGRFEDENWRVRKDGSRFWANVIITALHDTEGRLIGFSKLTRDQGWPGGRRAGCPEQDDVRRSIPMRRLQCAAHEPALGQQQPLGNLDALADRQPRHNMPTGQ